MKHIITEDNIGERIDKVIATILTDYSRHQIQTWIKAGLVTVNQTKSKASYKCRVGDLIELSIPLDKEIEIEAENIMLEVIYEDRDIIVVNKPKGMLVHPTHTIKTNTLVNGLLYHCETLSTGSDLQRPGIVHRLDRDTSGVMIAAKNDQAHAHLTKQFVERTAKRVYEAIVVGHVAHHTGVIKAPIGRDVRNRLKMTVVDDGRYAKTYFSVIKAFTDYTHIQCELKTGRTHQIRVHMNYMQHPIVGDDMYGAKTAKLAESQALFASELTVIHPRTNEQMTFHVERPSYFVDLLEKIARST